MSIKNKFATAVATASLLAGLFGSAFVPSALAARLIPLDTPSVAKTLTYTSSENYVMPVIGSNGIENGLDRGFYVATVEYDHELDFAGGYSDTDFIYTDATDGLPDDNVYIEYSLNTKNDVDVEVADLKATSSSSLIRVAWAFDGDDGAADDCEDIDDGGADKTVFGTSDTVTDVADVDGKYNLCFYSNGRAGVATVAVVANGVTLAPITITILGDIASITVVADGSFVAEDNAYVTKFFAVTAKDSAGNVINGPATGVGGGIFLEDHAMEFYSENPANQQGDDIDFIADDYDSNGALTATGVDNYSFNQYGLNSDTCVSETASGENDGDAGRSYNLQVEVENDDNDIVTSAALTMTCTGPEDDAKLSRFEVEATSGDLEYSDGVDDVISVFGYFTDQAGRPLGAGAGIDLDDDFVLDISANATFETDLNVTLLMNVTTNGTNKLKIATLAPNMEYVARFPYTISVDSSDLQSATAVAKSLATFYTATNADAAVYTLTSVRNAAKTRSTITVNFGAECSNQMVDFDVELANGDVKFLERRANIEGVAVLTMERRNTKIYVKAFCNEGDQESNLRGIRFR